MPFGASAPRRRMVAESQIRTRDSARPRVRAESGLATGSMAAASSAGVIPARRAATATWWAHAPQPQRLSPAARCRRPCSRAWAYSIRLGTFVVVFIPLIPIPRDGTTCRCLSTRPPLGDSTGRPAHRQFVSRPERSALAWRRSPAAGGNPRACLRRQQMSSFGRTCVLSPCVRCSLVRAPRQPGASVRGRLDCSCPRDNRGGPVANRSRSARVRPPVPLFGITCSAGRFARRPVVRAIGGHVDPSVRGARRSIVALPYVRRFGLRRAAVFASVPW